MPTPEEDAETFFRTFLRGRAQARMLAQVAAGHREWISGQMPHFDVDAFEHAHPLEPDPVRQLRELGAPGECLVISDGRYDWQRAPLHEVLPYMAGREAGVVIAIPDRLGLYLGEWGNDDRLLHRRN